MRWRFPVPFPNPQIHVHNSLLAIMERKTHDYFCRKCVDACEDDNRSELIAKGNDFKSSSDKDPNRSLNTRDFGEREKLKPRCSPRECEALLESSHTTPRYVVFPYWREY